MARHLPRKRRTREHIIADLSVNHVERHALLCGWTVERLRYDYGIDLEVYTFSKDGDVEPGPILVQVKATDELQVDSKSKTVAFRVDRRGLVHWLSHAFPVILVLFDARRETVYWIYVQQYFAAQDEIQSIRRWKARNGANSRRQHGERGSDEAFCRFPRSANDAMAGGHSR
jgi:hypothetical protein